jgi:hypothetical protein
MIRRGVNGMVAALCRRDVWQILQRSEQTLDLSCTKPARCIHVWALSSLELEDCKFFIKSSSDLFFSTFPRKEAEGERIEAPASIFVSLENVSC